MELLRSDRGLIEINEEQRRYSAYTIADYRYVDELIAHIDREIPLERMRALNAAWAKFLLRFLDSEDSGKTTRELSGNAPTRKRRAGDVTLEGNERACEMTSEVLRDLPANFTPSEVCPVINAGSTGHGGTGKSVSNRLLKRRRKDVYVTGPTNKTTQALNNDYMYAEYPRGKDYQHNCTTWFKTLSLSYENKRSRDILNTVLKNAEVNDAFEVFIRDLQSAGDDAAVEQRSRTLFKTVLPHMRVLLRNMVITRQREYFRGGYFYRNHVADTSSPFYQPPNESFSWTKEGEDLVYQAAGMELGIDDEVDDEDLDDKKTTVRKDLPDEVDGMKLNSLRRASHRILRSRYQQLALIEDQEDYREFVEQVILPSSMTKKFMRPPISVTHRIALGEEDSRTPIMFKYIHFFDTLICRMTYNPPYAHTKPPVCISTGSDRQFSAIDSPGSPLTYMTCPNVICDKTNTMVVRSEFFRRNKKTDLQNAEEKVRRIFPFTFEMNLPATEETFASLDGSTHCPKLIADPGHMNNSVRVMITHDQIQKSNRLAQSRISGEPLKIYDLVFVSSNIVCMDIKDRLPHQMSTESNPLGVYTDSLSTSDEKAARAARNRLWIEKMDIYRGSEEARRNCAGDTVNDEKAVRIEKYRQMKITELVKAAGGKKKRLLKVKTCTDALDDIAPEKTSVLCEDARSTFAYNEEGDAKVAKLMKDRSLALYIEQQRENGEDETTKKMDVDDADAVDEEIEELSQVVKEESKKKKRRRKRSVVIDENEQLRAEEFERAGESKISQRMKNDSVKYAQGKNNKMDEAPRKPNGTGEEFNVSKIGIVGKMSELFNRELHMQQRCYAKNVLNHLGNGTCYAKTIFNSSRCADQTGVFDYCPEGDMAVVLAEPEYELVDRGPKKHKLLKQIEENTALVEGYVAFERERLMAVGTPVYDIGIKTKVAVRGIDTTLESLTKDPLFDDGDMNDCFKLIILSECVKVYRDECLSEVGPFTAADTSNADFDPLTLLQYEEKMKTTLVMDYKSKLTSTQFKLFTDMSDLFTLLARDYLTMKENYATRKPVEMEGQTVDKKEKKPIRFDAVHLHTVTKWINIITRLNPDFYTKRVHKIYVHDAWLHCIYKTVIFKWHIPLSSPNARYTKPTLEGNYEHVLVKRYCDDIEAQRKKVKDVYNTEMFLDQKNYHKTVNIMVGDGVQFKNTKIWVKSSCVLRINGKYLGFTLPQTYKNSDWTKLFNPTDGAVAASQYSGSKLAHMGLMGRTDSADVGTSDEKTYHQQLLLRTGEHVFFPRPYEAGKGPEGSGVVVKNATGKILSFYSSKQVSECSKEGKQRIAANSKPKKTESNAIIAIPNPILPGQVSTTHALQGDTVSEDVLVDMSNMLTKSNNLHLGLEEIQGGCVVMSTRANNSDRFHVAKANEFSQVLLKQQELHPELSKKQQALNKFGARYEYYR